MASAYQRRSRAIRRCAVTQSTLAIIAPGIGSPARSDPDRVAITRCDRGPRMASAYQRRSRAMRRCAVTQSTILIIAPGIGSPARSDPHRVPVTR